MSSWAYRRQGNYVPQVARALRGSSETSDPIVLALFPFVVRGELDGTQILGFANRRTHRTELAQCEQPRLSYSVLRALSSQNRVNLLNVLRSKFGLLLLQARCLTGLRVPYAQTLARYDRPPWPVGLLYSRTETQEHQGVDEFVSCCWEWMGQIDFGMCSREAMVENFRDIVAEVRPAVQNGAQNVGQVSQTS